MILIQTERDALLKPLQAATGIVERRHTIPILSNVLIEGSSAGISFMATDLEIQITASAPELASRRDFAITVSARKLLDICRALPEAKLSLEAHDSRLQVKSGKSRFNLQTLPASDFPKLAVESGEKKMVRMSQGKFKSLLNQVQYAMAQQDIRYYLNGMLLVLEDGGIKLVATDGHRLSLASAEMPQPQGKQEIILPRKTVIELIKLLDDGDEEVLIELDQKQIGFTFSGISLVSKVVDGKFPDYTKVIPTSHKNHVLLDRIAFLQAMQRVAILSNEKFRGVRLVLTDNNLRIICNNNEQEEAQEDLEVAYAGEPLDIGFNVTYLLDVLNNASSDRVDCAFSDANSSCLITMPGDGNFKYVVMPMRI